MGKTWKPLPNGQPQQEHGECPGHTSLDCPSTGQPPNLDMPCGPSLSPSLPPPRPLPPSPPSPQLPALAPWRSQLCAFSWEQLQHSLCPWPPAEPRAQLTFCPRNFSARYKAFQHFLITVYKMPNTPVSNCGAQGYHSRVSPGTRALYSSLS